jgi:hypothetical protein
MFTATVVAPWAVSLKKSEKFQEVALPGGLGLASLVALVAAVALKRMEGVRGTLITLMYVLLAGSIGWNLSKAQASGDKKAASTVDAAVHKGWGMYSVILLFLVTLFDLSSQFS